MEPVGERTVGKALPGQTVVQGAEAGTCLGFLKECGWTGVSKGQVEDEFGK